MSLVILSASAVSAVVVSGNDIQVYTSTATVTHSGTTYYATYTDNKGDL